MKNLNRKLFVLVSMVLAFFVADGLTKNVFLANSPRIKPNLDKEIAFKIQNTINNTTQGLASLGNIFRFNNGQSGGDYYSLKQNFGKVALKPITKGVSAANENNSSYYEVNVDQVDWVIEDYHTKSGQTVKISYPKGQKPSEELLQQLYP